MSLILPIDGAGEIAAVTEVKIYSAKASLVVRGGEDTLAPALGLLDIAGEKTTLAPSTLEVKGEALSPALALALPGESSVNPALASLHTGFFNYEQAGGALDVSGIITLAALASLITQQANSVSGAIEYLAPGSVAVRFKQEGEASASVVINGTLVSGSILVLTVRREINEASPVTYEIAVATIQDAAASLDTGGEFTTISGASLEAQTLDGLQFMIDIVDAILYGGHGDC